MRRPLAIIVVTLALAGCVSTLETAVTTTTLAIPVAPASSATSVATTTTAPGGGIGGEMVKIDMSTLEPVAGLASVPIPSDSWTVVSSDGLVLINFEWDARTDTSFARPLDVERWLPMESFAIDSHDWGVIHEEAYYAYMRSGKLMRWDLRTGVESLLGEWEPSLGLWDGLHILAGDRVAALAVDTRGTLGEVLVFDTSTGVTSVIPVGPVERVDEESGYFDGAYQIPHLDTPGVVWTDGGLMLAYADGPEVVEVDFTTGEVSTHAIATTSWLDRLWAYWVPAASAKGPSVGTYSSAALSGDGRHLYLSGNESGVIESSGGTLVEDSEPLGVWVIDTETWRTVQYHDTPIQFVSEAGAGILGVATISFNPWVSEIYLLSPDFEVVNGPVNVGDGGCEVTIDGHLLCISYRSGQEVSLIETETLETVGSLVIGWEDTLHSNGVLEDWLPHTDS